MKKLIFENITNELDILKQLREYWEIQQENFIFTSKEDCKNIILEYLQFINVDIKTINRNIDEIVNEIYLQNKIAMI